MAKKRRRESSTPEETYEFQPPEFDEKEFLLKDMYGTKVLFVVSLLAVIIGIVAACIQLQNDGLWYLGLLLIILVIIAMKQFLALLRFRIDLIDQKMLISNYILFLFLALGVWILVLNI